jgi:hypothetical protein
MKNVINGIQYTVLLVFLTILSPYSALLQLLYLKGQRHQNFVQEKHTGVNFRSKVRAATGFRFFCVLKITIRYDKNDTLKKMRQSKKKILENWTLRWCELIISAPYFVSWASGAFHIDVNSRIFRLNCRPGHLTSYCRGENLPTGSILNSRGHFEGLPQTGNILNPFPVNSFGHVYVPACLFSKHFVWYCCLL